MWQGFWFGFGSKKTKCQGTNSRTHHGVSPEGVATTGPFCWFLRPQQAMSICFSNWIFGVTRWLWTVKNWMYPPRSLRYRLKSYLISSLLYLPNRNGSRGVSMILYVFFFWWNGMSMQKLRTFLFCGRWTCQQSIVLCRKKTSPHCRRLVYDCQAKQMLATLGLDSVPEACMYGLEGFFWLTSFWSWSADGKILCGDFGQQESPPIDNISWYLEPQEIEKQIELEGMEGEETQAWYSCRRLG